jgi:hypothetical protein
MPARSELASHCGFDASAVASTPTSRQPRAAHLAPSINAPNHTARAPDSLAKHNVSFDGTAPRAKSASGSSSQSYSITSIGSAVPLAASDAPIANFPICGCGYDVQLASPQV